MRIHVPRLETSPWVDHLVDDIETLARRDRFRAHELAPDPESADVVLFPQCHMVDRRLAAIRRHPAARRHHDKVMVYDERDKPWLSYPGVYVSVPRRQFDPLRQRAWGYLRVENEFSRAEPISEPDLLFSFVGSPTAPCRTPLFGLRHPDAVVEEVRGFLFWDETSPDYEARRQRFREILQRSRFVLCPRGHGTSSFRLYETMAAGRVPVIISDAWVAPEGPHWGSFSLRVKESETAALPRLLEERASEWTELSQAARAAYDDYFGDRVVFHRVAEALAGIREGGGGTTGRRSVRARALLTVVGDSRLSRATHRLRANR